ncbi:MAG: DNA polymerase III subunit delta' [Capnocytophaga sp.]|nr:DNA polymerase III subunit delta' [Capnocytophaga sp.]
MNFQDIIGHIHTKKYLSEGIANGRIAHTQLFVGDEGIGVLPMVIAYATEIICANGHENARVKCNHLTHPDLHFAFPVATTKKIDKNPVSTLFMNDWREFVQNQPYGDLFDWYKFIGIDNKQGQIGVKEAEEITRKLALKSFEGGYKIMIIWMAELMNNDCANKLLKLLEEPPAQTIFLLVAENQNQILPTILSRCQVTQLHRLGDAAIEEGLIANGVGEDEAKKIALRAQGNYKKALEYANQTEDDSFEQWFVKLVRTAYSAKGNKASILDLLRWGDELSSKGREIQKQFLEYCMEVFRQALLLNYQANSLVYLQFPSTKFQLKNFAPFIHNNNIQGIQEEIEKAIYHIERNGNGKAIFADLSIKLIRLIHAKQE